MANKPDSTSIVSMNSPTRNSRDDLSMVEQAKKTVKRVMIAKMVSKPESPSIYQWLIYVVCQLVGSTLACLTLKLLFNGQPDILPVLTQYKSSCSTSDVEAIAWEFIIIFILMFIVCGAAPEDPSNKALSGVAIGGAVSFNVIIAGPITEASMNRGRSFGAAIAAGAYKNLWVYIVAPVLGSLAAILVYCLLRVPESEKEETSTNVNHKDFYFHPDV